VNIAFYAPMKSPDHTRPSGDRRIARLLIKALESSGHRIELMSELRAWEGKGDDCVQHEIRSRAREISDKIIKIIHARPRELIPDIWFSYHLYHKAPDWIGPGVAAELAIPYVVAEASYAPKQLKGRWSMGHAQVIVGLNQAAAIICLNPRDVPALEQMPGNGDKIHQLAPFLDLGDVPQAHNVMNRKRLAQKHNLDPALPCLVCVAMMRDDVKLRSYENLAESLKRVTQAWQILLIGDGEARPDVENLFADTLAESTRFADELDQSETMLALASCDLFVWPAVNEAIGMAILEAQACGLAVVAGNSGSIPEIVRDGITGFVCGPDDIQAMAERIDQLLQDTRLREQFSLAAIRNVQQRHSLQSAAILIEKILYSVWKRGFSPG
jgi:glycosyltransferase involved in cell wall biosynthesis